MSVLEYARSAYDSSDAGMQQLICAMLGYIVEAHEYSAAYSENLATIRSFLDEKGYTPIEITDGEAASNTESINGYVTGASIAVGDTLRFRFTLADGVTADDVTFAVSGAVEQPIIHVGVGYVEVELRARDMTKNISITAGGNTATYNLYTYCKYITDSAALAVNDSGKCMSAIDLATYGAAKANALCLNFKAQSLVKALYAYATAAANSGEVTVPKPTPTVGLKYELSTDGTYYTVTGVESGITDIVIPETYNDKPVKMVDYMAFYENTDIISVLIPDSITSIGEYAFAGCIGLTSITIPDSVRIIGKSAFYCCIGLTSVTIPDGVTSIGYCAFYGCESLTSVTIPNSVTSIGYCAFYGCESLTSVTIPNSVTSIGDEAFYDCSNLTSVTIPDGVTSIGYCAFYGCESLTSVTIPNSVTSIGEGAFYCCASLTSVTIPDGVTSIGYCAFKNCRSLTSITIPDSVTSIEIGAFYCCTSLTSITIPNSVTSIGNSAFYLCYNLTRVTFKNTTGWSAGSTSISSDALADAAEAAEYLTSIYSSYTWTRE